jgi:hypothetical protein
MSRPVLSADDVRAAARKGDLRLEIPPGAIVTPLAREEAARRGIELIEGRASPAPSGKAPMHAATCDPHDVERIVERVRERVPGADAAMVRDIARRLLDRLGG